MLVICQINGKTANGKFVSLLTFEVSNGNAAAFIGLNNLRFIDIPFKEGGS